MALTAPITQANLGELLKRLYAPWEIEMLVNLTYPTLNVLFAEGNANLGGVGFYFPVRTEANEGHAYISEGGTLPQGQVSKVLQAVSVPTVHAGVAQFTGLSMAVSYGGAASFARGFDEQVQTLIESMSAYKEGVGFRSGNGVLVTFAAEPGTGTTTAASSVDDVGFLREGMVVDAFDPTFATKRAGSANKIVALDWVNRTITFESAINAAWASGDVLVSSTAQTSGAIVEPIGLEGSLLATGTYLGIDRALNGNWQANASAVGGLFDEDTLLRARTRLTQEAGIPLSGFSGKYRVVTHPSQCDVLFKLAIPRIQFMGGGNFDLGNSAEPSFGGIKFVTSYQAPTDKAYLGDWKHSQSLYTPNGKLHVDTEYNGAALKWISNLDAGQVFLKEYCAYINRRPNAFVRMTTLTAATR